jgi:acetyl-CoA C-acetyltransferase
MVICLHVNYYATAGGAFQGLVKASPPERASQRSDLAGTRGFCRVRIAMPAALTTPARPVAILGGVRLPFARSHGAYAGESNLSMLTAVLRALVMRFGLTAKSVGEVCAGAVIKHPRDWNLAREATLGSGLDPHTPAHDVQRACGTSLTAAVSVARRIALGEIECGIAGGSDTVSDVPIAYGPRLARAMMESARARRLADRVRPWLALRPSDFKPATPGIVEPRTGLSMGEHCELMAKEWSIARAAQDDLALASHRKAAAAWDSGFFTDLVVPHAGLTRDDNVRPGTSVDQLARLAPVYDRSPAGTLTAGNSTPLTDGASCVLLANESWARDRGHAVQAWLTHSADAAVDFAGLAGPREGLLMAPTYAIAAMLDAARVTLQDFDAYEIHEAFAAQVLCTLAALESPDYCARRLGRAAPLGAIDRARLNPHGSSVAIGHPFAATGTRLLATLARDLAARGLSRGLVSICTAGGMGVTAILER